MPNLPVMLFQGFGFCCQTTILARLCIYHDNKYERINGISKKLNIHAKYTPISYYTET